MGGEDYTLSTGKLHREGFPRNSVDRITGLTGEDYTLNTGKLHREGLPRNSVDRITGFTGEDYTLNYIPDKIRNATRRTDQLSGRSQVMGQFRLYRCKGVRYCCVTYGLQPGVKNVHKKIGQKPSRGQIVKSQKISVFYNALLLDKSKQRESSQ